jgi:type I restriction enzyme, R subunit
MRDHKIILVTDRVDLDRQIKDTFHYCGLEPHQARTGRHLAELILDDKVRVVTTVIDKFEAALNAKELRYESPDVYVLVDESHRGQYGALHAKMVRALPNACFIGFTGTPVMKAEKNTIAKFGGLIDTYTITQAVADKAVVPLLYEGRHVDQIVDRAQIDRWFDRITERLSREQAADLKHKFASTGQLAKAEQRVAAIAWDVGAHFADTWQGTGFKGQLVAQDKATALLYKKYLDEYGRVTSEVLISAPDDREGDDDVLEDNKSEVVRFWRSVVTKYGNEKAYNDQIIDAFKYADRPEIIIVVDKLLTGFDAPRNTVLYLTRSLKDHTLLQAIARVNRVYPGKEFGYIIDYAGVLQNLNSALDVYGALPDFDADDLVGTVTNVAEEVSKLPQRHSDLWGVFRQVMNKRDVEALERHLTDDARRAEFYDHLSAYARTLGVALSTVAFLDETPEDKVSKYRADLKFFMALRQSARRRFAEVVDFKEYEPKIQKLLDRHVGTGEVEKLTGLVNIFDAEAFAAEVEKLGTPASKADTIAYRTKRTISERMAEDPAFYEKFSKLLEDAIAAFRQKRLSDADYLRRVTEISASVRDRTGDDVPESLRSNDDAKALFGVVREALAPYSVGKFDVAQVGADSALAIDDIIERRKIVNWAQNADVQNRMRNDIDDHLFEVKDRYGLPIPIPEIDAAVERCLDVARVRKAS